MTPKPVETRLPGPDPIQPPGVVAVVQWLKVEAPAGEFMHLRVTVDQYLAETDEVLRC